ncbi:MAG: hypothetical protein ABIP38_15185 [Steroidobacteraceae bacterium]
MKNIKNGSWMLLVGVVLGLGMSACEKKGPIEKAGEEVDEAIDTAKNGGKESTASKVDDALDNAQENVEKAVK